MVVIDPGVRQKLFASLCCSIVVLIFMLSAVVSSDVVEDMARRRVLARTVMPKQSRLARVILAVGIVLILTVALEI